MRHMVGAALAQFEACLQAMHGGQISEAFCGLANPAGHVVSPRDPAHHMKRARQALTRAGG